MTYAIVASALLAGLLLAALVYERGQFAKERETWREERHSLLERIQHPQIVQSFAPAPVESGPPPVQDEWALVGTVFDPEPVEE